MAVTPTKRDVPTEMTSKLADLKRRLRLLGADDEEVDAVDAAWNGDGEDAYSDEEKRSLIAASDSTLRAMLEGVRAEYVEQTTAPDEETAEPDATDDSTDDAEPWADGDPDADEPVETAEG